MEAPISRDVSESRKSERDLVARLRNGGTQFAILEEPLVKVRNTCCDALITDYRAANEQRAEDRLWDSHQKVNGHYRSALAQVGTLLAENDTQTDTSVKLKKSSDRKVVEQRKVGAEYLKFIKSSQKFYRVFIGKLAGAYGGIPALLRVAKKFDAAEQPTKTVAGRGNPSTAELELCCHRTLIHLGDLSRYRESEFPHKEKDWAPAIGYYDLALMVCPNSGQPFNQRAVIALGSRSFFRATYYAYRSQTAVDPHPQAQDNLQRVMNMVQKAWEKQELVAEANATAGSTLPNGGVAFFLRLINQYSQGTEPSQRIELETEILAQIKDNITREPHEPPPHKLVLIGFAAQHAAQSRFESQPEKQAFQSAYILLLQFNIKMSLCFMQTLQKEVEYATASVISSQQPSMEDLAERITPVMRRTLPILHLYSAWMSKTSAVLASPVVAEHVRVEFWNTLASCLTSLTAAFPSQVLPNIVHMLEEEEDTIGFSPLHAAVNKKVWFEEDKLKSRWHDVSDAERADTKEMLYRIREFLVASLTVALATTTPLKFDEQLCIFKSDHELAANQVPASQLDFARPNMQTAALQSSLEMPNQLSDTQAAAQAQWPSADVGEDFEAERMVDSLVGLGVDDAGVLQDGEHGGDLVSLAFAQETFRNTEFSMSSPFTLGSSTVSDVMQKAFSAQPRTSSRNEMARTMQSSHSGNNSHLHSPVAPPRPERLPSNESSRSIGRNDNGTLHAGNLVEGVLPGLGASTQQQQPRRPFSPSFAARSSPLPPPRSHSRTNSSDIIPSIWSPGIGASSGWSEVPVISMSRRNSSRGLNLGNGTFGAASPTSADFPAIAMDYGAAVSTFGSATSNPWDPGYRAQKRMSAGSPLATSEERNDSSNPESPTSLRYGGHSSISRGHKPSALQHATAQQLT